MRLVCRLEFPYPSNAHAEKVARSVRVDDGTFIRTTVSGRNVIGEARADSPLGLLHTVEDYIACLSVAEGVLRG